MGGLSPTLSLKPQSQLGRAVPLVWCTPKHQTFLCCLQVSSFHQPATSSTSPRAQATQEIPGSDRVELKPVAKQSCSAWFLFKVLFSLHPPVPWHPERCFLHPVRRWSKPQPLGSNTSKLSSHPEDGGREGGGKRPKSEKCDVSDLEHRLLLWKCWWNWEFSYGTLKLYVPSRYLHLGEHLVGQENVTFLWLHGTEDTECLGWL